MVDRNDHGSSATQLTTGNSESYSHGDRPEATHARVTLRGLLMLRVGYDEVGV